MSSRTHYEFAHLNDKPALLEEISKLEQRLQQEVGEPVTLIAYTPQEAGGVPECRAGLDE